MSSSIVNRNRAATKEHYDTIAQEHEQLSEAAEFLARPENGKLSAGMRESLQALQQSLNCALCQSVTVRPVTLSCAHTFCCACIDVFAENNWNCPTCNAPFAMKSGEKFRNVNAATQTIVNSWSKICHTLMQAEDGWWLESDDDDDDDYGMDDDGDFFETAAEI